MITPSPDDPFYGILARKAPKLIHLFTRALFEYERMIDKLHKNQDIPIELYRELVIQNSAKLQEILIKDETKVELSTPIECFRFVIRARTKDTQPRKMGTNSILIVWDVNIPETVKQAKDRYCQLKREGYRPLKRHLGRRLSAVNRFPVDDEEVVMAKSRTIPLPRNSELPPLQTIFNKFKLMSQEKIMLAV